MSNKRIKNNRKNRVSVLVDPGNSDFVPTGAADGPVFFSRIPSAVQPVPVTTKDLWDYLGSRGCFRKKDPVIVATQLSGFVKEIYDRVVDKTIPEADVPAAVKNVVAGIDKALGKVERRMIEEILEVEQELAGVKNQMNFDPKQPKGSPTGPKTIADMKLIDEMNRLESKISGKKRVVDDVRNGRNYQRNRFGVRIKGNITWEVRVQTLEDIVEETTETCDNGTRLFEKKRTSRHSRRIENARANVRGWAFITMVVAGATATYILAQILAAKASGDEVEVERLEQELANLPQDTLEDATNIDPTDLFGLPVSFALAEGWQLGGPLSNDDWNEDIAQWQREEVEVIQTAGGVCNVCCQDVTVTTIRTMEDESEKCAEQTGLCPVFLPDGSMTFETKTLVPTVTVIESGSPELSFDEETCKLTEKYNTVIRVECGCPPADAPCPEFIYCPKVVETPDGCYIISYFPTEPDPSGCGCPELIEPEDIPPCYPSPSPSPSPSGCAQPNPACGWYPYEDSPGNWGWQLQPCPDESCTCDGVNTDPGYDPGYANEYAEPIVGTCIQSN
jgi:ribosomal protein L18